MLTKIRKLKCLLDGKNRNIVPNNIPISLIRVELHRETTNITNRIRTSLTPLNSGKAHKNRRVPRGICQDPGMREILNTLLELEVTERACTASMHDTLGDAFVVEAVNLVKSASTFLSHAYPSRKNVAYPFSSNLILQQRWPSSLPIIHDLEPVIGILHLCAMVGGYGKFCVNVCSVLLQIDHLLVLG